MLPNLFGALTITARRRARCSAFLCCSCWAGRRPGPPADRRRADRPVGLVDRRGAAVELARLPRRRAGIPGRLFDLRRRRAAAAAARAGRAARRASSSGRSCCCSRWSASSRAAFPSKTLVSFEFLDRRRAYFTPGRDRVPLQPRHLDRQAAVLVHAVDLGARAGAAARVDHLRHPDLPRLPVDRAGHGGVPGARRDRRSPSSTMRFFAAVRDGETLADIRRRRDRLTLAVRRGVSDIFKVQGHHRAHPAAGRAAPARRGSASRRSTCNSSRWTSPVSRCRC